MSSSELKNLASLAKQRLRNANYTKTIANNYNKHNSYFIKNISSMKKNSGSCEFVTISDVEDLQFLKKVFSMLNGNEEVYNPIGRLVDKNYYETLNETEKQFYVLRLSERYNSAKIKYEENKSTKAKVN